MRGPCGHDQSISNGTMLESPVSTEWAVRAEREGEGGKEAVGLC
jgi:hypothetical protein